MSIKSKKLFGVLVVFIILLATAVRFIKLDKVPASLYYDEIDFAYQVKSLLQTGKDYRGGGNPLIIHSMNADRLPFPVFFAALPSLVFSSPDYQVRAGAALAGVISTILAMVLVLQIRPKVWTKGPSPFVGDRPLDESKNKFASLITGIVFALSPWQIQFSRISFEAIFMQMVFLATIITFLSWQKLASPAGERGETKKTWFFLLTAFLLGLNVYTYRTMSLYAPIMFLVFLVIFYKDFIKEGIARVIIFFSIVGVMILPFLYATTVAASDQPRINQVSIFSDKRVPVFVQRNREVDSSDFANPEIGKKAVRSSFVFHNKVLSYINALGKNYYKNFSAEFLFLSGDPNLRQTPRDMGVLLFVDIVGLAAGLVIVGKNIKDKKFQLLLALLVLAPIPSDLTMDGGNHASRLMTLSGLILIVIGLGYAEIIKWLLNSCHSVQRHGIYTNKKVIPDLIGNLYKSFPTYLILLIALISLWLLSVIFYLHQYFVHFPIDSSREFGYGYREAIRKINEIKDQYKAIRLTENHDPPMPYYFYWANVPPKEVQAYGVEFGENVIKNQPLDKVKPLYWNDRICLSEQIIKLKSDTLYLVTYGNLPLDFREKDKDKVPTGIKLIDVFKYPDNEVAFYLITRDSNDGVEIVPDKPSYCKN